MIYQAETCWKQQRKTSKDFGVQELPFTERCYKTVRIQFPKLFIFVYFRLGILLLMLLLIAYIFHSPFKLNKYFPISLSKAPFLKQIIHQNIIGSAIRYASVFSTLILPQEL